MPRQNTYLIGFSVLSIAFALYLFNPFQLYFLNDDFIHIPLSKAGVLFQRNSFRPIGDLSIRMDYLFWGKHAWGYHLTNLLLHILNTVFVFLLSKALFKKFTDGGQINLKSCMVSIIFFVYAFHSETIFWIIGRSGSLGSLFFLLAFIFYLQRSKGLTMFILSLLCFELGLLAYESVWIFPLVAIAISLVDYKFNRRVVKKELLYITSIIIVFILNLFIRKQVIGEVVGGYEGINFTDFNLPVLALNLLKLTGRIFIPPMPGQKAFIVGYVLMAIIVGVVFILRRRKALKQSNYFLMLVISLFFLSLLPYLSLGIDTHSVEGERYLYLPSIFASIVLVSTIHILTNSHRIQLVLFTSLVLFHLYFLGQSAGSYRTASAITKTTMEEINLLKGKKHLLVDSLPQTVNGALVFRLGFEEGINWLKDLGSVDSVIILSLKKVNNFSVETYKVEMVSNYKPTLNGQVLVKDPSQKQTYIIENRLLNFNPSTDAWFVFTNNRLQVIK